MTAQEIRDWIIKVEKRPLGPSERDKWLVQAELLLALRELVEHTKKVDEFVFQK